MEPTLRWKRNWSTLPGGGAGMIAKALISLAMIGYYVADAFFVN